MWKQKYDHVIGTGKKNAQEKKGLHQTQRTRTVTKIVQLWSLYHRWP